MYNFTLLYADFLLFHFNTFITAAVIVGGISNLNVEPCTEGV